MKNWFDKRLNAEVSPEFYNEPWIIYFEEYLWCPVVCVNLEHALKVYNELAKTCECDGWLTFEQVCGEGDFENTQEDKAYFLLGACGICGIPLSLTDEEFWEDMITPKHMPFM